MDRAKAVSVLEVAKENDAEFKVRNLKKGKPDEVRIQYTRPKTSVQKIAESLEKPGLSASKVGEFTFDYYMKNIAR